MPGGGCALPGLHIIFINKLAHRPDKRSAIRQKCEHLIRPTVVCRPTVHHYALKTFPNYRCRRPQRPLVTTRLPGFLPQPLHAHAAVASEYGTPRRPGSDGWLALPAPQPRRRTLPPARRSAALRDPSPLPPGPPGRYHGFARRTPRQSRP